MAQTQAAPRPHARRRRRGERRVGHVATLRAELKSNRAFGRAVRAQFDIDTMHAVECARVARAYGERLDIYRRLSWNALVLLSSPTIPAPVRQDLEARILVGESVGGPDILRAHGPLNMGRPRQRADRPAMRVAA
jgi:hypothetical protein